MSDSLPWFIIATLFVFAFIYAPLRSKKLGPATPSARAGWIAAAVAAAVVAVTIYCVLALR